MIIHGSDALLKLLSKQWVRPNKWHCMLPYYDALEREADEIYTQLMNGLCGAVLTEESLPGLDNYLGMLDSYIDKYRLRFSRPDLLRLCRLLLLLMLQKDQPYQIVHASAAVLVRILGLSRFTRADLQFDWRPIYELYFGTLYGKLHHLSASSLVGAVCTLRNFFPLEATKEMWEEEILQWLSPTYSGDRFVHLCLAFLPTKLTIEEHAKYGSSVWFPTLWRLYASVEMNGRFTLQLPELFARLAADCPGVMDWSPYYEEMFTRIVRSLGLSGREGRVSLGEGAPDTQTAKWAAHMLGGPNSIQPFISRLMQCVEPFLHPSNDGGHTAPILQWIDALSANIMFRYRRERISKREAKIKLTPPHLRLTDSDIRSVVECVLPPVMLSVFTNFDNQLTPSLLALLAFLEPGIVLPRILDSIYPALNAVCEPHRLDQTLACLQQVTLVLVNDSKVAGNRVPLKQDWEKIVDEADTVDPAELRRRAKHRPSRSAPLRQHVIHLMKTLVNAIDINDIVKTTTTIQILNCFYVLVPIVDCPAAASRKDLTPEERHVAWLSRELPALAEKTLDKILSIIRCVAVCAPKSSQTVIGGLKETMFNEGFDEQVLRAVLGKCLGLMLKYADKKTVRILAGRIVAFVRDNQFESTLATHLTCGLVARCNNSVPEMWSSFMKVLKGKLKEALDAETRSKKDISVTALWYSNIACGLFYAPGTTLVKYQDDLIETLELIVACENRNAYELGVGCVWWTLFNLLRIYVDNNPESRERIEKGAKDGTAVRLWGFSMSRLEQTVCWHLTSQPETIFAQKILDKFLYTEIERLKKPEKLDRDALRKSLYIVKWCFNAAVYSFPIPKEPPIEIIESSVPLSIVVPTDGIAMATAPQLKMPDGANVRVALLEAYEKVVDYLTSKKDDVFALAYVTQSIRTLAQSEMADESEYYSTALYAVELLSRVNHQILGNKSFVTELLETYMQFEHLKCIQTKPVIKFTLFHQRILDVLTKLSMNMYIEVRVQAQSELFKFLNDYMPARRLIVDAVCRPLADAKAADGEIKGALYVINGSGMATTRNLAVRRQIWKTLVKFKPDEKPLIVSLMSAINSGVTAVIPRPEMVAAKPCAELSKLCGDWFASLPKTGDWAPFCLPGHLEKEKKHAVEMLEKRESDFSGLVSSLLALAATPLHYTRADLCQDMLWHAQRKLMNLESIKLLLKLVVDDRECIRDLAIARLLYYLRKNKPKTKRIAWTPPQKTVTEDPLECGLRADNLCVVYDSQNLPNTAEKWQKTVFHSKQLGCYRWPKQVTVAAPSPSIDRGPLSPQELAIVEAFSDKKLFTRWTAFLLVERQDSYSVESAIYGIIKYLLRNFPDHTALFDNVFERLQECLKSRERAMQRLGAELFIGLVRGVKHYSFERLDAMWKTLLPSLHLLYDQMLTETSGQWNSVMSKVWVDDPRRHWWLAESFIEEMRKIAPTPWQQATRLASVRAIYYHESEMRTRISRIAWDHLPRGRIETQRLGVSNAIMASLWVLMANERNSWTGVAERFRPDSLDSWLEKFEKEVEMLFREKMDRAGRVKSDSNLKTARASTPQSTPKSVRVVTARSSISRTPLRPLNNIQSPRSTKTCRDTASVKSVRSSRSATDVSKSPSDKKELAIVYLRTLLEVLLCYYEECNVALTPVIMRLFPKLVHYANEDDTGNANNPEEDVRASAATLILDYMSSLRLTQATADMFLRTLVDTFHTPAWRVRLAVMRIVQVIVPSNLFACQKADRPKLVRALAFEALADQQIEVRAEAAKCLLAMQQFSFIDSQSLIPDLTKMLSSRRDSIRHGGMLGLGSVVLAHPYSTPEHVIPVIRTLCQVPHSETAAIKMAAHTAITGFRSSHRDIWEESCRLLGADLVYSIENALAPPYYV